MTNQHVDWTEAELAVAEKAWKAGHSGSEISRKLPGRSRCAIIGVAHRRGWTQASRKAPAVPAAAAPEVAKPAPVVIATPPAAIKAPPIKPVRHRTAPRPGLQKATPVAFGYMPATTQAEADQKREQAAVAGAQHIQGFNFPANDDAIPLIDRRSSQCSWPVGNPVRPAKQLCCGQPVIGYRTKSTATYCDKHRLRAAPAGVPSVRDLTRSVRRAA